MSCPLLARTQRPACRAVSGGPLALSRDVVAAYCRGPYGDCPGYRYVRASGHAVHPADFRSWVMLDVAPGRMDARPDAPIDADPW